MPPHNQRQYMPLNERIKDGRIFAINKRTRNGIMYPLDIKVLLPFNSIKSSLKNWRKCMFPPNPTGLEEMARQLAQPECSRLLEYDVGRLACHRITDALGKIHLLLYDPEFVRSEFKNVIRVFFDATFQTTPRLGDVYQMLTGLGVTYDHALPFAHVLMSSKTEAAYTAVLNAVCNLINGAGVKVVMTDFEQALRNASKAVFPNAYIAGCNVHYDRALLKKINKLSLSVHLREDEAAKMFVKKVMALAFLPAQSIETEYHVLKNALPLPLKEVFRAFFVYYERQWLRVVKPTGFSVFGLARRTNNVTESYNSVLADELGLHPSAWTFLVKLLKLTSQARNDMRSLRLSKPIRRHPRYSTAFKKKELVKAWKQLYSDEITAAEFLDITANLKGHIRQRMAIIASYPEENELEIEEIAANLPAVDDPDYEEDIFNGLRFDDQQEFDEPPEPNNDERDQSDDSSVGSEDENDYGPDDPVFQVFDNEAREAREARRAREAQELAAREARAEIVLREEAVREARRRQELAREAQEFAAREAQELAAREAQEFAAREAQEFAAHEAQELAAREAQDLVAREAQELAAREVRAAHAARVAQEVVNIDDENIIVIDITEDIESDDHQDVEMRNEFIADEAYIIDIAGDNDGVAAEQGQRAIVSRSRKKNLRKKRNRALKAQNGGVLPQRKNYRRRRAAAIVAPSPAIPAPAPAIPPPAVPAPAPALAAVAPAPAPDPAALALAPVEIEAPKCVICLMNQITQTFIPCGHSCCCATCVDIILNGNLCPKWCPKCRCQFTSVLRTWAET